MRMDSLGVCKGPELGQNNLLIIFLEVATKWELTKDWVWKPMVLLM
jgi:hypothetical protein